MDDHSFVLTPAAFSCSGKTYLTQYDQYQRGALSLPEVPCFIICHGISDLYSWRVHTDPGCY